jgi:hypothetical protein
MTDDFKHVSITQVERMTGVEKTAVLPTGQRVDFGVNGDIKKLYNIDTRDLPLPVDYIVASTGA